MGQRKQRKKNRYSHSHSSNSNERNKKHRQRSRHKKEKHKKRRFSSSDSQSSDSRRRRKNKDSYNDRNKYAVPENKQIKKNQDDNEQHVKYQIKQENRQGGWQSQPEKNEERAQNELNEQQENLQPENPETKKKQQPNFQPSGILLQYYNARQGISLKFHQPPQAHKPFDEWRIYPFKDGQPANPILLKESCYLIGKDDRVCDILCQNSSISRQHAVIQFRSQYKMNIEGTYQNIVKPYIMDLESTNGTLLNDQKIEPSRYYELLNKDVLKFGLSEREYVLFKVPKQTDNEQ